MESYGIQGVEDSEVAQAIKDKYGETDDSSYAHQIGKIAGRWSREPHPVGWNVNSKKRQYRRACRRYLSEKSKAEIQPKGFIETFIFYAILSGIISFFTQFLLKKYFGDGPDDGDESD